MSLRVWLPLTKDLRNQGLDDVTVTNNGATFDANGKLGGCYQFGNGSASSNGLFLNSNLVDVMQEEYSVAVWVKPLGNHYHYNGTIFSSGDWNKTRYSFGLSQDNSQVDILCKGHNNYLTCAVPINTWTHLICTCDSNNVVRLYKNGEYINFSARNDKPDSDNANQAAIGRETYANGYFTFNGMLNDFRLYDHCLSPLEVKQISQGLVLHYPLNRNGWGQENLGNFASVASNWIMENLSGSNYTDSSYGNVIKLVTSSTNQRMYNYVPASMWQSGKVYTVSFLAKADTNGRTCDMSRSIADFSSTFTLTTNWKRYNGKITSTATPNGGTLSFRIHQSGATVYITQIKVEEGELATPYCPYYNESLYTIMGLNSTTEYDCSGFCNNGTRTGIFSWTSDTPKYEVSTNFSTISQHVHLNYNTNGFKDSYSISLWLKYNSTQTNSAPEIFGIPAYACLYISGNLIYWNTNDGTNNPFKNNGSTLSITPYVNNWHHFVITGNGTNVILYIDGMEAGRAITYKHFGGNKIVLSDKDNTRNTYSFIGLVSDFRIYATALSANDVKSLYNNSAYIDNQGNIYGAVYEEV